MSSGLHPFECSPLDRENSDEIMSVFPPGCCPHPDLPEVVRVQFDERVGILVKRFDHAFEGHMMNPINDQNFVTNTLTPHAVFYRLRKP